MLAKLKVWALILFIGSFSVSAPADTLGDVLRKIPVQDGGRLKPFDTFARESLQLIYGKRGFNGKDPVEIVFTMMMIPQYWTDVPLIEVRLQGLRDALRIQGDEKYLTASSLFQNDRVPLLFQELKSRRERQEKLNPYYSAIQRLESQLALYHAIQTEEALRVVPDPSGTWKSVAQLDGDLKKAFDEIKSEFVEAVKGLEEKKSVETATLARSVDQFIEKAQAAAPANYADLRKIDVEVWYNQFHPFQWAWICYVLGVLGLSAYFVRGRPVWNSVAWVGLIAGFLLHALGMAARIYLAGRPPVSNMYETVVWVPWVTMIFAFILERIQKNKLLLLCASLVSILCLVLTDLSPTVLDGSIHPLEPVLRSNFWLTIHVLTILIGYSALFLAFALGDLLLVYYLIDENRFAERIKQGAQSIYRSIQFGVVFLAAGTILGGVWADYSWGRFWGWDPKETWALICVLGYLAVLHGRLVGWVKNFGLAVWSVLAFSLVLMAWYGVNFVLGAGLHSYGFGAGGVEYVTGFVAVHLIFVIYVTTLRYGRLKTN